MLHNPLADMCATLGIAPSEIENLAILLLPENLDSASSPTELNDTPDSIELAKALKRQGVPCKTAFDLNLTPRVKDRRGIDIWLGVIWLLQNAALPIAVGVLSNWLTGKIRAERPDRAAGPTDRTSSVTVHAEIRIEGTAGQSRVRFDGPASVFLRVIATFQDDYGSTK
ncbi:MAG TPA: hypothetical protein VHX68_07030 [Planctomycetaceae bacterium]|jgi:hypothetical protein|nr:hypothetical protein [Planctomycetaceae bacterium]